MEFQSLFHLALLFCLLKRISTEQCETYMYEEPVTTLHIKNVSSQVCGFNGAKVAYSVIDSKLGEISFNITTNGTLCDGEYVFEVETFNDTHTRQKFVICTDDTCNDNNGSIFTLNANELHFQAIYIYTGQYYVELKRKNGSQIWKSEVFSLTTNYTQLKLLDVWLGNQPLLRGNCDLIRNKNMLKVVIIANETIFLKQPEIKMFVIPSNIHSNSGDLFCYENYSKNCSSRAMYEYSCDFLVKVSSIEYKIYTKIDDPRCNTGTLWADISKICVTATTCKEKISIPAPAKPTIGSTQKIVIGSVVLVAIVAAIIFLSVKRLRIRASRSNDLYGARYSRQTADEESEYLIIYARELEQFERVVDAFKRLLSCGKCSRVTTLYELDPKRCLDPRKWLQNKLRDGSVSVILLINMAAPYACNSNFVYRKSHCFDYLFPYAVQLLQSYDQRSYHNLYKVLTPEANPEAFRFVNTLTEYNVPQHTSELLSDLKISGEETVSFEEFFKNECNAYHNCIIKNSQYLQDIFVKKMFL